MNVEFFKYQGTGNDFILIDNRTLQWSNVLSAEIIAKLCDRRFGIGADGLMLLQSSAVFDFEMIYMNADGRESSMCGNGGRCIVAFAQYLGILKNNATTFKAIDGEHHAIIEANQTVRLGMCSVTHIERRGEDFYLNTGSPHYVKFVEDVDKVDVLQEGREIRYNDEFAEQGTNVNFVQILNDSLLKVRTYERGVEAETFSCGTGVTAAALAADLKLSGANDSFAIKTLGGNLQVRYKNMNHGESYTNITLAGATQLVFTGEIDIHSL
jgi:diaminopimelate epimerase